MNLSQNMFIQGLVALVLPVLVVAPLSADTLFTTDFDSYTASTAVAGQDGWQWVPGYEGNGWLVQDDGRARSGDQAILSGPEKNEWVGHSFTAQTTGTVDISLYLNNYAEATDMSCQIFLTDGLSSTSNRAGGIIISGTDIKYYQGTGGSTDSGYDLPADDTWTNLRISCDVDNLTYKVYMTLDGGSEVCVAADGGFKDGTAVTEISAFQLRNNWFASVGGPQVWGDDVTVSAIPEPTTLSLLVVVGSALALRRRRKV